MQLRVHEFFTFQQFVFSKKSISGRKVKDSNFRVLQHPFSKRTQWTYSGNLPFLVKHLKPLSTLKSNCLTLESLKDSMATLLVYSLTFGKHALIELIVWWTVAVVVLSLSIIYFKTLYNFN